RALADVHGDGEAAVAAGFDRLRLAQAHVHVEPALLAATDLGLAGAQRAAAVEQARGDIGEAIEVGVAVAAVTACLGVHELSLGNERTRRGQRRIPRPQPQRAPARGAGRTGAGRDPGWAAAGAA